MRGGEFAGEGEVHQVAGDGDVVGLVLGHVGDKSRQDIRVEAMGTVAVPVHIAERALRDEVAAADFRQRAEMRVSDMGEEEHPSGINRGRRAGKASWAIPITPR
jgi:hypothetical protein